MSAAFFASDRRADWHGHPPSPRHICWLVKLRAGGVGTASGQVRRSCSQRYRTRLEVGRNRLSKSGRGSSVPTIVASGICCRPSRLSSRLPSVPTTSSSVTRRLALAGRRRSQSAGCDLAAPGAHEVVSASSRGNPVPPRRAARRPRKARRAYASRSGPMTSPGDHPFMYETVDSLARLTARTRARPLPLRGRPRCGVCVVPLVPVQPGRAHRMPFRRRTPA